MSASQSPRFVVRVMAMPFSRFVARRWICVSLCFATPASVLAQDAIRGPAEAEPPAQGPIQTRSASPTELKKLPLEELVDVEISSASRRPELLSQSSSAVDVITAEQIERAGAMNLPDALRLGTEMQVAQIDGHSWAISARGFNISSANKLQVLMDGRSLYTPLYSGVFWDVQQTFLPDLQQIEIVRGPGATLWGANAVNGVINIITKDARDTQGILVEGGGGNELEDFAGVRYGGRINKDTYYRVYVMHKDRDGLHLEGDGDAGDGTDFTQGGFRIDSQPTAEDTFTLQGDGYSGAFGQFHAPDISVDGENVIGRWTRQFDKDSSLMLQAYYDGTHRLIPGVFEERRNTFDIEVQQRVVFGPHDVLFGGNYRLSHDHIGNLGPTLAFIPDQETVHLASAYVQDEWHIVPDKWAVTVGSKFEYNSFSGFEFQPSGRVAWTPTEAQTIWGAISRAVRTPTRIDQNLVAPNPSSGGSPVLLANPDFESEDLLAFELGYRIKPVSQLSLDLAGYYNDYTSLRSVEPSAAGGPPFTLANKLAGTTYGAALSAKWRVTDWWQLNGTVSGLHENFRRTDGSRAITVGSSEGNDPDWMFVAQSMLDLPWHTKFDTVFRYVSALPLPATPGYFTMDVRFAWSPMHNLELAIVGRDLLDDHHPEFRSTLTHEVERSVFATIKWSY